MRPTLLIVASLFLLPTAAFAQANYTLLPGGYSSGRGFERWDAIVLSNRDGKAYHCIDKLTARGRHLTAMI
jgi:hypothetical protein